MDRIKLAMKPVASPVLRSTRLSEQARERIRSQHYSLRAAKTDAQQVRGLSDGVVCGIRATMAAPGHR